MALKIRLKRLGRKGQPFYHIVITDSRNARDGRFIEKLGYYDPAPALSTIEFSTERVVHWYELGARPTDSVAAIFKAKKVDVASLAKELRATKLAAASV